MLLHRYSLGKTTEIDRQNGILHHLFPPENNSVASNKLKPSHLLSTKSRQGQPVLPVVGQRPGAVVGQVAIQVVAQRRAAHVGVLVQGVGKVGVGRLRRVAGDQARPIAGGVKVIPHAVRPPGRGRGHVGRLVEHVGKLIQRVVFVNIAFAVAIGVVKIRSVVITKTPICSWMNLILSRGKIAPRLLQPNRLYWHQVKIAFPLWAQNRLFL
jgi:hypothetical protein